MQAYDHTVGSLGPFYYQQTKETMETMDNHAVHVMGPRAKPSPRRANGRLNKSGQDRGRLESSPKAAVIKLADRGKSVLTPVTERSETSSANISLRMESPLRQEIRRSQIDGETSLEQQIMEQKDPAKKKKKKNKRKSGVASVNVVRPTIGIKEAEEKGKEKE
jgi:hypothetical protein